ncbi:hypothetical protein BX600DRAFT_467266 [Xylariales sp. PMI_506]|nr:hypothetical protein BX600DRAFT_467266 [Xylariales sp. PMI_506]
MAAISSTSTQATSGQATAIGSTLSIAFVMIILATICVAKRIRAMPTPRQVEPNPQVVTRRCLDLQTVNAIPIVTYTTKDDDPTSSNEELTTSRHPTPTLRPKSEGAPALCDVGISRQSAGTQGVRIINRLRAIISMSSSPSFAVKSQTTAEKARSCAICIEDFTNGANLRQLPCGHIYHVPCIDAWLKDFAVICPLWHVYPHFSSQAQANNRFCSRIDLSTTIAVSEPRPVVLRT